MSLILNGNTGISGVDGTSGTPALQGNDSNTGISFGTDTVTINTGGSARVTTDASGNVGIGTASPDAKLEVIGTYKQKAADGNSQGFTISINGATDDVLLSNYYNAAMRFETNNTERMRLDASGNLLVGTATTVNRLTVAETTTSSGVVFIGNAVNAANSEYGRIRFGSTASSSAYVNYAGQIASFSVGGIDTGDLRFYTSAGAPSTEKMRIDSSGNLLVGTTSNGGVGLSLTKPDATGCQSYFSGTTTGFHWRFGSGSYGIVGSISSSSTATTYSTSSDYRLKENVAPMTGALAKVAALKPCTYTWKVDGSDGEGFIAHELQAVCPQAVTGEKDAVDEDGNPKYQGVDTSFLVATLTAAIQELTVRLEALENK